jgi:hypothetical protein
MHSADACGHRERGMQRSALPRAGFTPQGFANSVWALGLLQGDRVVAEGCGTSRDDPGDAYDYQGPSATALHSSSVEHARAHAAEETSGMLPELAALHAALGALMQHMSAQELATSVTGLSKIPVRVAGAWGQYSVMLWRARVPTPRRGWNRMCREASEAESPHQAVAGGACWPPRCVGRAQILRGHCCALMRSCAAF